MQTSEPLFAYPLAVKMNSDGFGVSYPQVVSTPDTVFASYSPDFQIVFDGKNLDAAVESHDDFSVGISQKEKGDSITNLRVTHGSPYIFASVSPKQSFFLTSDAVEILEQGDNFLLFMTHGKVFAFFYSQDEVSVDTENSQKIAVSVFEKGARFSLAVLPNRESLGMFKQYAFDSIIGTDVDFGVANGNVKSRFEITTENNGETLFGLLPKSTRALDDNGQRLQSVGSYQTLRGEQQLYQGRVFGFSRGIEQLPEQLDVVALSEADKDVLRSFVRDDAKTLSIMEEDTYFLGKKLFALANVLDLAEQLDMRDESALMTAKLKIELELWRSNTENHEQQNRYFYYDPVIKGVVGEKSSFGSELFNDHNFHYGYFMYAASILSRYDYEYFQNNADFINLLVKDIANIDRTDTAFPYLRGFDAYEGHSWASGMGLFADGNNQESSSEAVNAWYALYLWSGIIGNKGLRDASLYLYSEESSSALEYWLNIDRNDARYSNFQHSFVSLLWGGKVDSATWFSGRPEAKLAIQILPISPGSSYLGHDTKRVEENMASEPELRQPVMFRDYIAMYRAFYDLAGAKREIAALKPEDIDGANSRSFMEAWLLVLEKQPR
jgi:endoglucanase Acf2